MADDIVVSPAQPAANPEIPAVNPEVAKMMAIHLNGGIEPTPVVQDTPAAVVVDTPAVVTDHFSTIKEKFGYQSHEDAIKEIEELRNLRANPTPAALKFENEQSEKLFKAIQKADRKEVYSILSQQERLESLTSKDVDEASAAEIIKLNMSLKYKDLTPQEIDYKFNRQYAMPKEPTQATDETDEEFSEKKSAWQEQVNDIKMNKIIDAKLAKPELESAKSKIVLPEFNDTPDEDYIQWRKSLEEAPRQQEEISKAYKAFTPKDVESKIKFTDEANKIDFEFQYEPDGESFTKSVEMGIDFNRFLENFKNQDGTPDRKGFLNAIHFAINRDKILMEAIKQAKNATIKSFLPDNSGVVRHLPQTHEPSELEQNMKRAGII